MAKPRDDDINIREEMKIALFWRGLIGDYRYGTFDPEDMLRWYKALELRGPDEIRAVKNERYFTAQTGVMQGVVAKAPHPPLWLINVWLEHFDQTVHSGGAWALAGGFVVLVGLVFGNMQGCTSLQTNNPLAMNPPALTTVAPYAAPVVTGTGFSAAGLSASGPGTAEAPAPPNTTGAAAMAPVTPTITGPHSGGIAAAAQGLTSSSGTTGAQNTGASAGVIQGGSSNPP